MRNAGSTPAASKFTRKKSAQKACSVEMAARSSFKSWSRQRSSPAAARSFSWRDSLARMSEAAARVNVTTSMRSTSAPSSAISRSTRSTSTVVLPEPAAALRSMLLPRARMARSCSSVQLGMGGLLQKNYAQYAFSFSNSLPCSYS